MGKRKKSGWLLDQSNPKNGPVKILPYLYLGPRSSTVPGIALNLGITHIISLGTSPDQGDSSITYHRFGLLDTPEADLGNVALLVADIINNAKKDPNAKVLVHCVAAVSRSPAVIASYLITECGMTLREALVKLVQARDAVRPNEGFLKQLRELDLSVRGHESLLLDSLPSNCVKRREVLGC
jgi:atypical dual specificity phosphatase